MSSIANVKSFPKSVAAKILFLAVILILVVSLSVAQVQAQASTVSTNYRTNLNLRMFVPCAASGAGEYVQISGPLNIAINVTTGGKTGLQGTYELQPKGVSGVGLSTGASYQSTGVTRGTFRGSAGALPGFSDGFKLSGPAGSFVVLVEVHVAFNSKGGLTVFVDNFRISCKRPGYPSYP